MFGIGDYQKAIELTEQLCKLPKQYVEMSLLKMMTQGKIDFLSLNKSYVEFLNNKDKDRDLLLTEAYTCVSEWLVDAKQSKKEWNMKRIYRSLYLLEQSEQFNLNELMEKFGYDKEVAKKLSYYERWKENNKFENFEY